MGSSVYVTVIWDGEMSRQEHALDNWLSKVASPVVVNVLDPAVEVVALSVT